MEDSILKFTEQFSYQPELCNSESLKGKKYTKFILGGMGGSHLCAGILKAHSPSIDLYIHKDYGLPEFNEEVLKQSLFIASSYSGNTEEVLDFADDAFSRGLDVVVISVGGKLIDFAKENNIPYIQLPNSGIQPRLAIGYSTIALTSITASNLLFELKESGKKIDILNLKKYAIEIAKQLNNKIPIIYASVKNKSIAYNWKIKLNETGKIPAFYNLFPELNHNEMQGFDFNSNNGELSDKFHFVFIKDSDDSERNTKRMEILETLLQEKGFSVSSMYLSGEGRFEKIFSSLILVDWISLELAKYYKLEPNAVPFIEEFKKRLK